MEIFCLDSDCEYDDTVNISAEDIAPTVTWGVSPDQGFSIEGLIPDPKVEENENDRLSIQEAIDYMKLEPGNPIKGTKLMSLFWKLPTADYQTLGRSLNF